MILLFFKLLIGHALCDFALQNPDMARGKNWNVSTPGQPAGIWPYFMAAHCAIHAGSVWLLTGSLPLGLVEFALHFGIDCAKCAGATTINTDQGLHVLCKLIYLPFL